MFKDPTERMLDKAMETTSRPDKILKLHPKVLVQLSAMWEKARVTERSMDDLRRERARRAMAGYRVARRKFMFGVGLFLTLVVLLLVWAWL